MTASAVGNKPEGGMTTAREAAIRSAMHADERLFEFKVRLRIYLVIFMYLIFMSTVRVYIL